jgi:hypothetical protein
MKRWQDLPCGREKYGLYLASREWAVKREAVKARSGGVCERCLHHQAAQVHHQTYERKYREPLDDLVHLCAGCHEFVSGKTHHDPIWTTPAYLFGRPVRSVYLAMWSVDDSPADALPCSAVTPWGPRLDCVARRMETPANAADPARQIGDAVAAADFVFAWIDDEIDIDPALPVLRIAIEMGKMIVVALRRDFVERSGELDRLSVYLTFVTVVIRAEGPIEAWNYLWWEPSSALWLARR